MSLEGDRFAETVGALGHPVQPKRDHVAKWLIEIRRHSLVAVLAALAAHNGLRGPVAPTATTPVQ